MSGNEISEQRPPSRADTAVLKVPFARALARWCREEFGREVKEGYPILRSTKNAAIQRTVDALISLGDRGPAAVDAMLRWQHQAVEPISDAVRKRDQRLLADMHARQERIRLQSRPPETHDRTAVRRVIRKALGASRGRLGGDETDTPEGRGELMFEKRFGEFVVFTSVDFGGKWDVSFCQHVRRDSGERLIESFSWPKGLGIPTGDRWDSIETTDAEHVANAIVELAERFLRAVPSLLEAAMTPTTG